jgi:hypothetical protein
LKEWANYTQKAVETRMVFLAILRESNIGASISVKFIFAGALEDKMRTFSTVISMTFGLMLFSFSDGILREKGDLCFQLIAINTSL